MGEAYNWVVSICLMVLRKNQTIGQETFYDVRLKKVDSVGRSRLGAKNGRGDKNQRRAFLTGNVQVQDPQCYRGGRWTRIPISHWRPDSLLCFPRRRRPSSRVWRH